jgi:hypothetical protein
MEAKIDELMSLVRGQSLALAETKTMLAESLGRVAKLEETVTTQQIQIDTQDKEILQLKDSVNFLNQQSRANSIRLLGFPVTEDEKHSTDVTKSLSTRVYDKILKPVLTIAKAKGDLSTVPTMPNTIANIYRAGKLNSPKPPPIVISFSSSQTRLAVLRNKRNNLPTPSDDEKRGGIKSYILAEDLTSPTFRMLKLLHADERVSKAWSTEGRLYYILRNDSNNTIHRVKSVFLPIEKIIPF